ncbi:RelB/DinJ family addiction module antitoxin [Scardovia wiggsiae F0424]|uniref:RelB/DinJ family addiction module antitoxin n=1 Tax=Scardovia wiggsiae F0424 TaxID=857290 RepID=J0LMD2_9BIFI|nr:type II toxin-antitoxin system RelB/DinJ family antitoxin [Scardovia wiggsiae]EJD64957.1 RelB/DinJ family addiction module antitoxin [Scardovia wiggsiae F0424]
MTEFARIQVRTTPELKEQATHLFESMGMDLGTAINMFLAETVTEERLPFQPTSRIRFEKAVLRAEREPAIHAGTADSMKAVIGNV